tara:strand:+ start:149 stop:553 length:405 start_codon:yes stop_codon:yes gene_type:complete
MPRKKIEIDPEMIRGLARIGATWDEIAGILGIARTTLAVRMREKKYRDAYEQGVAEGDVSLRRAQYDSAMKGKTGMLVWLGKNRLNQTDRVETHNETTIHDGGNALDKLSSAIDRLSARSGSGDSASGADTGRG